MSLLNYLIPMLLYIIYPRGLGPEVFVTANKQIIAASSICPWALLLLLFLWGNGPYFHPTSFVESLTPNQMFQKAVGSYHHSVPRSTRRYIMVKLVFILY